MPIYKQEGKKNGLQKYRVVVSFTTQNGEYKQLTGTAYGKEEAKQLEMELQSQTAETAFTRLTINELIQLYLNAKKGEVRETTYAKNERNLKIYVSPFIGTLKLSKLTVASLQEWKNSINKLGLATRTKNNAYRELSTLLNFAVRMKYISQNPLPNVKNFRDVDFVPNRERIRYYTQDQFLQFVSVAKSEAETKKDWRFYVFFCIAFYTGMRKGEIHALKWSDIENNTIHVRRSISQKIKGAQNTETAPKNISSYRDLQAPAPLLAVLDAHKERFKKIPSFSDEWRVCGGETPLRDSTITKACKQSSTVLTINFIG